MSMSSMPGFPPVHDVVLAPHSSAFVNDMDEVMAGEEEDESPSRVLPPIELITNGQHNHHSSSSFVDVLSDSAESGRFHGHTTPVIALSYAAQAQLLLTGGDDETIRLFNAVTRSHIATLQSANWLPSPVRGVALSPDGTRAFIAMRENSVQSIRVGGNPHENEPNRFEGHEHWVRALSVNWAARRLATAANDSTVRLWNIDTGEEVRRIQGNARAIAVALTDRYVAVGSHDVTVRLYLVDDELAPPREFVGHKEWVMSVALGEQILMTGSIDTTARVFDVASQECLCVLQGHSSIINAVALCKTEKRGLTGANDSSLVYWCFENGGSPLLRIQSNFGSVRAITYLSKPNEVCFSGWDGSVRVYDLHHQDRMRLTALCAAGHERLGRCSSFKSLVNRDLLTKIRSFLFVTADMV